MDEILKDERFAHIPRDPAFKRIPKLERKVKIDKRFQSMFNDKNFKVKYTVDKRGRPVQNSSTENLRRYYALDSSDESEEINSDEDNDKLGSKERKLDKSVIDTSQRNNDDNIVLSNIVKDKLKKLLKKDDSESSEKDEEEEEEDSNSDFHEGDCNDELDREYRSVDEKVRARLEDMTVDYARGEGVILTDSSSDEESSDDEADEDDGLDHGWGELDHDAEGTDESTHRLAVCHMDWDRVQAQDLLILFHSFLPKGGIIHSVTVYPSEYGLERMKLEEEKGPLELRAEGDATVREDEPDKEEKKNKKKKNQRDEEEEEEGDNYQREKLRQYQLNRLRYYYAVVVCDSVATADVLYKECDGMEYESSSSRVDLRFIPDDTTFDQKPRETCTELPNMTKYEPQQFITTALQQKVVRLTWDETDPRRLKFNEKINSGKVDDIDDSDLKVYVATSSEEEMSEKEEEEENLDEKKESASKYRALLESIDSREAVKKEKNMEMQVTWGIDLKEKVQRRMKYGKEEERTPFEKYLQKRKEKNIAKREKRIKKREQLENGGSGDENEASASEDDIPSGVDMNNEYFREEFETEEFAHLKKPESKNQKKKKSKKKKDGLESEDEETKKKKAELELLLMDKEDTKKHFSLKDILVDESKGKKKKKKNKRKMEEERAKKKDDDFQIDLQDTRFSALYTSHLYNIDPADPHYKKTKGMEALRQEKLSRRDEELPEELPPKRQKIDKLEKKMEADLSLLVNNVKRKTQTLGK